MLSTSVPLPIVNANYFYLEDKYASGVSLQAAKSVSVGEKTGLSAKWNFNGAEIDLTSMFGSGSMAVIHGLIPSAGTGLNANISAGTALVNGPTQKKTSSTVALAASSTNYIWLSNLGILTSVDDSITPPPGAQIYIGAAITNDSSVTSIDLSGVIYLQNGVAFRTVTDTDQPVDTPPSSWRGFTKTARATYFWNGTSYDLLSKGATPGNGYKAITGAKSDADYILSASEYSNEIIKLGWTGWTTGKNVVVPTVAGAKWVIHNATGQTATVKTSGGTGIAIANTKHATVYCDGTNIVRITADT
mgnify:CR=1 FL=1